jgi:hypothetical protein
MTGKMGMRPRLHACPANGTSSFKVIVSEIIELEMALGIHDLSRFTARV